MDIQALCAERLQNYPLYSQENETDPMVMARLFALASGATWHVTEYDPEQGLVFAYVTGLFEDEWGYASLDELAALRWQ